MLSIVCEYNVYNPVMAQLIVGLSLSGGGAALEAGMGAESSSSTRCDPIAVGFVLFES